MDSGLESLSPYSPARGSRSPLPYSKDTSRSSLDFRWIFGGGDRFEGRGSTSISLHRLEPRRPARGKSDRDGIDRERFERCGMDIPTAWGRFAAIEGFVF